MRPQDHPVGDAGVSHRLEELPPYCLRMRVLFSIPVSIIRPIANLSPPAPGLPGPFSLGTDGVLEDAYRKAGFKEITVRAVDVPLRFCSAAEGAPFERESFGALHAMLANVSAENRNRAWAEIEAELRQFEGPDGFVGPCELLVGVAHK